MKPTPPQKLKEPFHSVDDEVHPDGVSLTVSEDRAYLVSETSHEHVANQFGKNDMNKSTINNSSLNLSRRKSQLPRVLTTVSDGVRKTAKFIGKHAIQHPRSYNKRPGYSSQENLHLSSRRSSRNDSYHLTTHENQDGQGLPHSFGDSIKSSRFLRSLSRSSSEDRNIIYANNESQGSEVESVVNMMELFLRHCFLSIGSCMLGVKMASSEKFTFILSNAFYFIAIAWSTCMLILFLTFVRQNQNIEKNQSSDEETVIASNYESGTYQEYESLLGINKVKKRSYSSISIKENEHVEDNASNQSNQTVDVMNDVNVDTHIERNEKSQINAEQKKAYQKELDDLYVIRVKNMKRVTPNSLDHALELDNELFFGKLLVMIKTEKNTEDPFAHYFREKKRRFEFQFQMKFKRVPEHPLFFVCELDNSIKLGAIQRAFVKATLNFVKKMNSGFHYNLSGTDNVRDADLKSGNYENTLMAFTVNSMDRLVETKSGEIPPKLGCEIYEDPESLKKRKKKITLEFNTESTYTMAFWSAYADMLHWKVLNFPAIKPFSLSSVIGDQAFRVVIYSLKPSENDLHIRNNVSVYEEFEVSNAKVSSLGRYANEWIKTNKMEIGNNSSQLRQNHKIVSLSSKDSNKKIRQSNPELEINENSGNIIGLNRDNDDDDRETVEELGEGIYLKSGDNIYLRDASCKDEYNFLSTGCGFAILQSQTPTLIQIQKPPSNSSILKYTSRSKVSDKKINPSKLIHSGDVVIVKQILDGKNDNDPKNIQYLTTHKRKWLKWVSTMPKQNGYFQIFTNETEGYPKNGSSEHPISSEMQTSYVRLGGSFYLNHLRWSCYSVGTTVKSSARLGGRMLTLLSNQGTLEDSDDDDDVFLQDSYNPKEKKNLSISLQLSAEIPHNNFSFSSTSPKHSISTLGSQTTSCLQRNDVSDKSLDAGVHFDYFSLDVPAWIEMVHRTDRTLQRVYVVRLTMTNHANKQLILNGKHQIGSERASNLSSSIDEQNEEKDGKEHFVESLDVNSPSYTRLRTGKDLTTILRVGLSNNFVSSYQQHIGLNSSKHGPNQIFIDKEKQDTSVLADKNICSEQFDLSDESDFEIPKAIESTSQVLDVSQLGINRIPSEGNQVELYKPMHPLKQNDSFDEVPTLNIVNDGLSESDYDEGLDGHEEVATTPIEFRFGPKKKKWISNGAGGIVKVAKGVKTGTAITGKQVVKHGKMVGKGTVKVGKGTVNAGLAITKTITSHSSSTNFEPRLSVKSNEKSTLRRTRKDHHVAINKTLKDMDKQKAQLFANSSTRIMAGQLSAPDQSCRTVSHILSELSKEEHNKDAHFATRKLLESEFETESNLDTWFLRGGPTELGITPESPGEVICQSLVARCLWESHWREEWYGSYETHLCFYAPLENKPCLSLAYIDIQDVHSLERTSTDNPLSSFPILIIETAWRCHYLAFSDDIGRKECMHALYAAIHNAKTPLNSLNNDVWRAHLLQSFQISNETYSSQGGGKWARISSQTKGNQRIILNGRRMTFDVDTFLSNEECEIESSICSFTEKLLGKALSFSLESFDDSPKEFVDFLNDTSRLKSLPLHKLDYCKKESLCIFVNIYHCLLQHALLLSSNGPPTKRTFNKFMKTNCYEIGGDVFSLVELECCVIRGSMSSPINPRPPFAKASKRSLGHRVYALRFIDARINFILHSGDTSKGSSVPILSPSNFDEKLSQCATSFFHRNVSVDILRKSITLPKVCEVYRDDLGGAEDVCLSYCLQYFDEDSRSDTLKLMSTFESSSIKYQSYCDKYVSSLNLVE